MDFGTETGVQIEVDDNLELPFTENDSDVEDRGNCEVMESELECYCCQENTTISELLMAAWKEKMCVTELTMLKIIEESELLELQAYKGVSCPK